MKLPHLPTQVLDVISHSLLTSQSPAEGMRDVLNLRRTAKPFDDIKVRASQPSHFQLTTPALHHARDLVKAGVVEKAVRENDPLAFAEQFTSMSLGSQKSFVDRAFR